MGGEVGEVVADWWTFGPVSDDDDDVLLWYVV